MSKPNENLTAMNVALVDDYFGTPDQPGLSLKDLCKKYGRSPATVTKRIRMAKSAQPNRVRHNTTRDPRAQSEKKPLTLLHTYIGLTLKKYLEDHKMNFTTFGLLPTCNMSRSVVSDIASGARDLTILEVHSLAEVLGVPYEQLIVLPKDFTLRPVVTYEPS